MPLGMEVDLSPEDFVFDGDPASLPKKGAQFSARVYCGQTVAWIEMSLGTEVGLGPNDIVLAPRPQKGGRAPNFRPIFIVPKRLDASRCLSPGDFVFDGDPATPRKKGTPTPPNFWRMSIAAKRLNG